MMPLNTPTTTHTFKQKRNDDCNAREQWKTFLYKRTSFNRKEGLWPKVYVYGVESGFSHAAILRDAQRSLSFRVCLADRNPNYSSTCYYHAHYYPIDTHSRHQASYCPR